MRLFFLPVQDVLAAPFAEFFQLKALTPLLLLVARGGVVQPLAFRAGELDEFPGHGFR